MGETGDIDIAVLASSRSRSAFEAAGVLAAFVAGFRAACACVDVPLASASACSVTFAGSCAAIVPVRSSVEGSLDVPTASCAVDDTPVGSFCAAEESAFAALPTDADGACPSFSASGTSTSPFDNAKRASTGATVFSPSPSRGGAEGETDRDEAPSRSSRPAADNRWPNSCGKCCC